MLCTFCPLTIWVTSLGFCRNRPESSADKVHRACESKIRPSKRLELYIFQDLVDWHARSSFPIALHLRNHFEAPTPTYEAKIWPHKTVEFALLSSILVVKTWTCATGVIWAHSGPKLETMAKNEFLPGAQKSWKQSPRMKNQNS